MIIDTNNGLKFDSEIEMFCYKQAENTISEVINEMKALNKNISEDELRKFMLPNVDGVKNLLGKNFEDIWRGDMASFLAERYLKKVLQKSKTFKS